MNKYEHLKFLIERFDHYYDSVNSKGAFYIGLNTFIFGGICVSYITMYTKLCLTYPIIFLALALIASNVISIYFTIMAIMPFLKDGHKFQMPSLVYFGGIARHELQYFQEKFTNLNETEIIKDMVQQAHCLAIGLDGKYKKLKISSHFIIAQFFLMLPILFLIVKNLKP